MMRMLLVATALLASVAFSGLGKPGSYRTAYGLTDRMGLRGTGIQIAQAAIGKPNAASDSGSSGKTCYQIAFIDVKIDAIHSPNSDTDSAWMHLSLDGVHVYGGRNHFEDNPSGYLSTNLYDVGPGDYPISLISNVCMKDDDSLLVEYGVLNRGNPSAGATAAQQNQANLENNPYYGSSAYPASSDGTGSFSDSDIGAAIPKMIAELAGKTAGAGCDDTVAGERLKYDGVDLKRWLYPTSLKKARLDLAIATVYLPEPR